MKIFEVRLRGPNGDTVYSSLVPEIHVQEKINTLLSMNSVSDIKAIEVEQKGDISSRYIRSYSHVEHRQDRTYRSS